MLYVMKSYVRYHTSLNKSFLPRLADGPALPIPAHRFVLLTLPPLHSTVLALGGKVGPGATFTDAVYEWEAGAGATEWTQRVDLTLWEKISGFVAVAYT